MAASAKVKTFFPKTRLAELVARSGGMTRDDAIDGALQSIESMRGQSDAELVKSIAAMTAIVSTAGEVLEQSQMHAIQCHADQVVTLAGTFCYSAIDAAARSLCDIADGLERSGVRDCKPIAVHVQAMQLMAPGATSLSPQLSEKLLAELAKVTDHYNFGSLEAPAAYDVDDNFAVVAI